MAKKWRKIWAAAFSPQLVHLGDRNCVIAATGSHNATKMTIFVQPRTVLPVKRAWAERFDPPPHIE